MLTKAEIKTIIGRGNGEEIGRLWIQDSWEVDRGREGVFSDSDIKRLLRSIKETEDIDNFNKAIELYKALTWLSKDAKRAGLESSLLMKEIHWWGKLDADRVMQTHILRDLPLLVTEKQLQALKSRQIEEKTKRLYCLKDVIAMEAYHLSPEEFKPRYSISDYIPLYSISDYISDYTNGRIEDLDVRNIIYSQAIEQINKMVDTGKLKLEKLDVKDSQDAPERSALNSEAWLGYEDSLSMYVSGEQLLKAKLPGWREYIDTFELYDIPKDEWYGDRPPELLAIVQNVSSSSFDKNKAVFLEYMRSDWLPPVIAKKNNKEQLKTAKDHILYLMACRQVLHEAAPLVGINCAEDADIIYADLEKRVEDHDVMAKMTKDDLYLLHLPPIRMKELKPPASLVKFCRSILEDTLGKKWWLAAVKDEEEEDSDHDRE